MSSSSQEQLVMQLVNEVALLRQQVAELQAAERGRVRARRWPSGATGKRVAMVIGAVVVAASGSIAWAASTGCPSGLPVCFVPGTPALAADMNLDLSTLKDWIEQKVGPVANGGNVTINGTTTHNSSVSIQGAGTAIGPLAAGKVFTVTGNITNGVTDLTNGIEFRHDNQSQGIGIGFAGLYATGYNTNQDLNLTSRGAGWVKANANNLWSSGAVEAAGELRGGTIRQRNCNWGVRGPSVYQDSGYHSIYCPVGQYMAGWQCAANGYLDGDCAAWCCNP